MTEWSLKVVKSHYVVYHNNVGLVRIKCRHCEYVVIAEKRLTLFALNLIHTHLRDLHNIPLEDLDK